MIPKPEPQSSTADREIVMSRVFAARRALVFRTWTDPAHIGAWWGPRGFTTTTMVMDVRVGGLWIHVMHGPDGTNYPSWIRYLTIDPDERLVYDQGGGDVASPANFQATVTFTELGSQTLVTMRLLFPSAEARAVVVERFGAIDGGQQHLARLAAQLARIEPAAHQPSGARVFRFTRTCAAPRTLVFRVWTEAEHLARWWGPSGFTNPRCDFAAHAGGAIHITMRGPDGSVYPMGGTVLEVTPPDRLAFTAIAYDQTGATALENLTVVTFVEDQGRTTVTVETTVLMATAIGEGFLLGMEAGWNQSLVRLETVVARLHSTP
jgi:uncharacterized protein YndB with AHSA1/START domain